MVRKDDWDDFNFFEFTKTRFMAQDVANFTWPRILRWLKAVEFRGQERKLWDFLMISAWRVSL